jgi:hypothetical protein
VDRRKKIFLIIGLIGVAVGGFVLTKFLTRNVRRIRGGTVTLQTFDTPPIEEPSPEPQSESPSELLDDILADGDVSAEEVASIVDSVQADGKLTEAEKEIVAEALIAQFGGEPVTASAIAEAGIDYADLPPETPVETRLSESGEPIVITAEVADALELVANPAELVGAIFTDPAKALMALGNIGADMSDTERQESQTVVVASVIVGAIASLSIRRM